MIAGDTLTFDVNWNDPNMNVTTFNLVVDDGMPASVLSWILLDQSGLITVIPGFNNNGNKTFVFSVSDECYKAEQQISLTIQ